jgi:hypothetical protein
MRVPTLAQTPSAAVIAPITVTEPFSSVATLIPKIVRSTPRTKTTSWTISKGIMGFSPNDRAHSIKISLTLLELTGQFAGMAKSSERSNSYPGIRRDGEMVDALALGASGGNPMEVQVLFPAQKKTPKPLKNRS